MGFSPRAGCRVLLGHLAFLWALLVPGVQQEFRLTQPSMLVASPRGSITIPCRVSKSVEYVHWVRQLEGQTPERLLYLALSKRDVQWDSVLRGDKVNAAPGKDGKSCTLSLMKLEKRDEGRYFCAALEPSTVLRAAGTPAQKALGPTDHRDLATATALGILGLPGVIPQCIHAPRHSPF